MIEEVTDKEVKALDEGKCPDCQGNLLGGPWGGVSQNVKCEKCGASFNVIPGAPGSFGKQRLSRPEQQQTNTEREPLLETAYKLIEEAIAARKLVEHCSINQDGGAEGWTKWLGSDIRRWHPSRFRIDGQEVWPGLRLQGLTFMEEIAALLDLWPDGEAVQAKESALKLIRGEAARTRIAEDALADRVKEIGTVREELKTSERNRRWLDRRLLKLKEELVEKNERDEYSTVLELWSSMQEDDEIILGVSVAYRHLDRLLWRRDNAQVCMGTALTRAWKRPSSDVMESSEFLTLPEDPSPDGGPVCTQCGAVTHPRYAKVPNLSCWSCGQPMKSAGDPPDLPREFGLEVVTPEKRPGETDDEWLAKFLHLPDGDCDSLFWAWLDAEGLSRGRDVSFRRTELMRRAWRGGWKCGPPKDESFDRDKARLEIKQKRMEYLDAELAYVRTQIKVVKQLHREDFDRAEQLKEENEQLKCEAEIEDHEATARQLKLAAAELRIEGLIKELAEREAYWSQRVSALEKEASHEV